MTNDRNDATTADLDAPAARERRQSLSDEFAERIEWCDDLVALPFAAVIASAQIAGRRLFRR